MKSEKGLGIIGIIIIFIIIAFLILGGVNIVKKYINNQKDDEIKTNMLSIQGACRVLKQNSIVQKNTDMFVGTKISEMTEDNLINEFKSKNIIKESEYEKYYCLNNDNLKQLNIDVVNEENSYYLVNYDEDEIIITNGYKGKYKLSEINKIEENKEEQPQESTEESKEEQPKESKEEQPQESTEESKEEQSQENTEENKQE